MELLNVKEYAIKVAHEATNECEKIVHKLEKDLLFKKICKEIDNRFTQDIITSLKTTKGNTQKPERVYIAIISEVLHKMNLSFTSAGSQQSKDFRNVGGIGLNIEAKKTDGFKVMCNDTCPSEDIYYVLIYTGSISRKCVYPPQMIFKNGGEIKRTSPWIENYLSCIETLKNDYCRGENKKNLCGDLSVYIRPNISFSIKRYLKVINKFDK